MSIELLTNDYTDIDGNVFHEEHYTGKDWDGWAVFSGDYKHRYVLTRVWNSLYVKYRTLPFVLLNPSTATAAVNDPTITRCIGFAKREGYAALAIFNLFSYRATDPRELKSVYSEQGYGDIAMHFNYRNARYIGEALARFPADTPIVCGWGAHKFLSRVEFDLKHFYGDRLYCLGKTKDGSPRHPLYLRADAPLEQWP